ncbi:hypothetical protein Zmor_004687 [Zophobas morio]|uniref:PHD-type domain-containing protein n=1 Tax=Zophobas morio TaxID=2755281 RepID=A0AA38INF3_9CUCU|nr:hypothetical protein Zmor_004687 [Zophobas morio]
MAIFCLVCNGAVTPSTPSIKCSSCKKYCHTKCSRLDSGSLDTNVSWTCPACSPSLLVPTTPISLSAIEQLIAKQFLKLRTELLTEISQLIDDKFQQFNNRIATVESDVKKLQEEVHSLQTGSSSEASSYKVSEVVSEIYDRNVRSKNVILYNIPESSAQSAEVRVNDDVSQIISIFEPLGNLPQPKKLYRMGPPKPNSIRPLKLIYENNDEVMCVLRSNKNNTNKRFLCNPDLTKLQRDNTAEIINDFNMRKSRGETDIKLIYRNNMASIVGIRNSGNKSNRPKN